MSLTRTRRLRDCTKQSHLSCGTDSLPLCCSRRRCDVVSVCFVPFGVLVLCRFVVVHLWVSASQLCTLCSSELAHGRINQKSQNDSWQSFGNPHLFSFWRVENQGTDPLNSVREVRSSTHTQQNTTRNSQATHSNPRTSFRIKVMTHANAWCSAATRDCMSVTANQDDHPFDEGIQNFHVSHARQKNVRFSYPTRKEKPIPRIQHVHGAHTNGTKFPFTTIHKLGKSHKTNSGAYASKRVTLPAHC